MREAGTMGLDMHEAVLESLPYPVLVHDEDTVLYVNGKTLTWLKCGDRTQIEGKPLGTIVHEDGREAGIARRRLMLEQGVSLRDISVKLIAMDGTVVYVLGDAERFFVDDKPLILVVGRRIGRQ